MCELHGREGSLIVGFSAHPGQVGAWPPPLMHAVSEHSRCPLLCQVVGQGCGCDHHLAFLAPECAQGDSHVPQKFRAAAFTQREGGRPGRYGNSGEVQLKLGFGGSLDS